MTSSERDFRWLDGERLIVYFPGASSGAHGVAAMRGLRDFALLTTKRAAAQAPILAREAARVLYVPDGAVPEAAAAVRADVDGRPIVALGGGRVIDAAKAISGVDGLPCAAVPTTLSGAPMTAIHRMPAGVDDWNLVRPSVVVADPDLMASQSPDARAASAMNALAHAAEALYGPMANPVTELVALRAAALLAEGLEAANEEDARHALSLGAIMAGYAVGSAGIALHHLVGQTLVRVTGVPHARAYAVLLPHTLRAMVHRAPRELGALAGALGAQQRAEAAPVRVAELAARAGATRLTEIGMDPDTVPEVVEAILARGDLGNTQPPPDEAEIRRLIEAAL